MKLVPFRVEHLYQIVPRETVNMDQAIAAAIRLEGLGPAFTAIDGERVIGCGGVARLWGRVGEAWTLFGAEIAEHPVWLHRTVRTMLRDIMDGMDLDRLQVNVLADSERNCRWVKRLGFRFEGLMERFGPNGEDYARYAMIRGRDGRSGNIGDRGGARRRGRKRSVNVLAGSER